MKIRYELETAWPTDVCKPDGVEAIDWHQVGEIPFLPVAGMFIDCGDGDFREVLSVYWVAHKPDEVTIFFEDDTERALDYWASGGWQTDDLPKTRAPGRKKKVAV